MNDTTDLLEADGTAAPAQDAPASAGGARANGRAANPAATDVPGSDSPAAAPAAKVRRRAVSGGGLASLVLPELQSLAGDLGITGVARLRKSQLIEAIQERQGGAAATSTATNGAAGSPVSGPAANGSGANTTDPDPAATVDANDLATIPAATPAVSTRTRQPRARQGSPAAEPATGSGLMDGTQQLDVGSPTGSAGTAAGPAEQDQLATAADPTDASAGPDVSANRAARSSGAEPTDAAAGADGQDVSANRTDGSFDADSQRDRSDREGQGSSDRLDRSRERFLEREARRQERAAAQAAGTVEGGAADQAAPAADRPVRQERDRSQGARSDRPQSDQTERSDRLGTDRAQGERAQGDRPQGDRPLSDRAQGDRVQGDRADGTDRGARQDRTDRPQPARQDRDTPGPLREDEDDVSGRRGRFRERGRGRNRNTRDRFVAGEAEPVIGDDDVLIPIGGILDISDSYGFVRTSGYLTGPNDVYVSLQQVRRYGLRRGDAVTGAVRQQRDGERKDKYNALVRLDTVNGVDPAEAHSRPEFTKLTPLYPQDRLRLETAPDILTTRVIDLVMPVGKGQRALIVSPPKAGKTMVMQAIANAITTNNPEVHLMVVLVDERPEEVTDMQRSVKGEVIASTFDRPPQDHITVAELSIERAKRLVELGHDVVVLLDSITRLGRAYNLGAPASGRILTGGVDSAALYPPKRFLGAARNIENGGSLTIFATALVETGSAMDTVIFEEFKGTGNAELKLDRRLADKRIFPAIDVDASGTRKEEILLAPQELRIVLQLRRVLHALDTASSLELLLDKMKSTRTNVEFLMQIQKTTVDQDQSA